MNIFKKRITLIANVVLRLRPAKNVVRYMCKKSRFRLPFQKEYGKRVSTLFEFEWKHLHHIYWSTGRQLSCKKSVLVICKSLKLFVNTMSVVDNCSLAHRENLMEPFHMRLSQKIKIFLNFFLNFQNLRWILNIFKKKMILTAYLFLKLRPAKKVVR